MRRTRGIQGASQPTPALNFGDPRLKDAFSMAPEVVQAFGLDSDGLPQVRIPVHLPVGVADDKQAPPEENALFGARLHSWSSAGIPALLTTKYSPQVQRRGHARIF